MSEFSQPGNAAKTGEVALWWLLVIGGGFLIPGVGLVVGATLAFTRYRHERAVLRWSFLAVGAAMFAFQLVSLAVGLSSHGVSAPTQVS